MLLPPIGVALAVALVGGWMYLRWAPPRALDVPNERSSHSRPTLRGGGLVIVAGFLAGLGVWLAMGGVLSPRALGWLAGSLLVAGVSFVDDLRPLPAILRLTVHLLGAAALTFLSVQVSNLVGIVALPIAFAYVIVLTNVYNFMDGIDGLAASEAIVAGVATTAAGLMIGNPLVAVSGSVLMASSAGFWVYNLPPARLFMGDVGSTFLGFSFGGVAVLANIGVGGGRLPNEFAVLLFAPFLFDSLATLARRILRGERWYAAHRSHFYQRLVSRGLSHGKVTSLYAVWAIIAAGAALAGLSAAEPVRLLLAVVAYAPLVVVVALVWRMEQPHHGSTVVTQGQN